MIDPGDRAFRPSYDAAIIGGGTAGCSAALHLALRGAAVLLLERRFCGSQASGVNYGGVRQHGRHPAEIPLSIRSRAMWDALPDIIGHDCEFEATGHVKLARTAEDMDELEDWAYLAREHGLAVELLAAGQLRERFDYLGRDLTGASLLAQDGQANPRLVAPYFARAAERAGADVREGVEAVRVSRDGTAFAVELADGRVAQAEVLINTAGAWAAGIAAQFGETVDAGVLAPNMLVTEPLPVRLTANFGICGGDIYVRQIERGNVIFGGGAGEADSGAVRARPMTQSSAVASRKLTELMPFLGRALIIRSWTGMDGLTPDRLPVLGASATTPGLFHAFGFSGHGFQLGPAVGAVLSELVFDGATPTPIEGLSITRFAQKRSCGAGSQES